MSPPTSVGPHSFKRSIEGSEHCWSLPPTPTLPACPAAAPPEAVPPPVALELVPPALEPLAPALPRASPRGDPADPPLESLPETPPRAESAPALPAIAGGAASLPAAPSRSPGARLASELTHAPTRSIADTATISDE